MDRRFFLKTIIIGPIAARAVEPIIKGVFAGLVEKLVAWWRADNLKRKYFSLIRKSLPQMIAFDICGVQPMTGPTGLIFALASRYSPRNPLTNGLLDIDISSKPSGCFQY
jgi:hypothetical protein